MNLKLITVDRLVTLTKLHGSTFFITGHTTPEGWPFAVAVAIEIRREPNG